MKKIKLLLVEDDPQIRILCSRVLGKADYFDVVPAINGREALEKMKEEFFPIVVTDLVMPEVDGFQMMETARESNSSVKKGNIKQIFIVISVLDETDKIHRAISLGAYDVLPKPPNFELLSAKMRNYYLLVSLMTESHEQLEKINRLNREMTEAYENRMLENQALNDAIQTQKEIYGRQVAIIKNIQSVAGSLEIEKGKLILEQCENFLSLDNLGK